jgi:hypothetical protein
MSDPVLFELTCGEDRLIFSNERDAIKKMEEWIVDRQTVDIELNRLDSSGVTHVSDVEEIPTLKVGVARRNGISWICAGCDALIEHAFPEQFIQLRNRFYIYNDVDVTVVRGQCPECKEFKIPLGRIIEPPLNRGPMCDCPVISEDSSYEEPTKGKRKKKRRRNKTKK